MMLGISNTAAQSKKEVATRKDYNANIIRITIRILITTGIYGHVAYDAMGMQSG